MNYGDVFNFVVSCSRSHNEHERAGVRNKFVNLLHHYTTNLLMNTSDRKDRLIDLGFWSMTRAYVESYFRLTKKNNQEASVGIDRIQHSTSTKMRHKIPPKSTSSASQRPQSQMEENQTNRKACQSDLTCQRREIDTVSRAVDMIVEDIENEC